MNLKITEEIHVKTAKRTWILPSGDYIYVGRAKKNSGSRIKRHAKRSKKIKWHIDHITSHPACTLVNVIVADTETSECVLADILESMGLQRIEGFGSSDCRCKGHLLKRVK